MLLQTIEERNALAGRALAPASERLSVTVARDCARLSLRVGTDGHEGAGRAFGRALPARIGGLSRSGDLTAICLGPDEWFLLAPSAESASVETRFARDTQWPYSLVDISHREVGIDVRGEAAGLALGSVCALDLEAMPAGSATRTILDKAQVILIKQATDHYRIEVWQSFATHVWALLAAASREIDLDI